MESVLIVERDDNGDVLVSWRYPNVDPADERVVIARSGLEAGTPDSSSFFFSKSRSRFLYSWVIVPGAGRVKAFCVTLVASELWPEKYGSLCRLFAKQLAVSPVPTAVLQAFLSALTRGTASAGIEGVPDWDGAQFNIKASYLAGSIPQLVRDVGAEGAALLYAAMLMKKRVAIYSPNLVALMRTVRTCPQLVWHRQSWDILHPLVSADSPAELQELRESGVFVAGFSRDPRGASDVFDVLADLEARRVTVAEGSRESFACQSFLKDAAGFFGGKEEAEDEQVVLKELLARTKALVGKIQALGAAEPVTMERLAAMELPPHMDRLLVNVAAAEGIGA